MTPTELEQLESLWSDWQDEAQEYRAAGQMDLASAVDVCWNALYRVWLVQGGQVEMDRWNQETAARRKEQP